MTTETYGKHAVRFDKDGWYGNVHNAAVEMIKEAVRTGKSFEWEWNGMPMEAPVGDLPRHVIERWDLNRTIYQVKHGIKRVSDL